jgi:hypothetical protein
MGIDRAGDKQWDDYGTHFQAAEEIALRTYGFLRIRGQLSRQSTLNS